MNRTANRVVGASTNARIIRCCFGGCTSDSKYASVTFHGFPKPCFRVKNNLVTSNRRHIDTCADCKKCQRWITSCQLSSISDADRNAYVCTLHFVDRQPSDLFPDPLPAEDVLRIRRTKRNIAKKRKAQPDSLDENAVMEKEERVESGDFTKNKAATNQGEKKLPTAKEKLRSASKANSNSDDFDPLDLNNLLLSTTSIFQGMCKELELSTIMNKHVDFLNVDKERITLTTSAGDREQSLQIVIVNRSREDATPSFSEATDDLERMLTDVEKTVMTAEMETMDTRPVSTQTDGRLDGRHLEAENRRLRLEIASLKSRMLCMQTQLNQQDVPKLLVVCDDE